MRAELFNIGYLESIVPVYNNEDTKCGYEIKATEGSFNILIGPRRWCCETFGCISSDDNFEDFKGALVRYCELVRNNSCCQIISAIPYEEWEVKDVMFVNVVTTSGTLQFALYNKHNGAYGHNVKMTVKIGDGPEDIFVKGVLGSR